MSWWVWCFAGVTLTRNRKLDKKNILNLGLATLILGRTLRNSINLLSKFTLLVLLTGCTSIVSVNKVGTTAVKLNSKEWEGIWDNSGVILVHTIDENSDVYHNLIKYK